MHTHRHLQPPRRQNCQVMKYLVLLWIHHVLIEAFLQVKCPTHHQLHLRILLLHRLQVKSQAVSSALNHWDCQAPSQQYCLVMNSPRLLWILLAAVQVDRCRTHHRVHHRLLLPHRLRAKSQVVSSVRNHRGCQAPSRLCCLVMNHLRLLWNHPIEAFLQVKCRTQHQVHHRALRLRGLQLESRAVSSAPNHQDRQAHGKQCCLVRNQPYFLRILLAIVQVDPLVRYRAQRKLHHQDCQA